jgi:hypothetical protein
MSRSLYELAVRPQWRTPWKRLLELFAVAADIYLRRRYAILFYSLLFTLVASPFLAALEVDTTLLGLLMASNLLLAVVPIGTAGVRRALMILVVVALAGRFIAGYLGAAAVSSANLAVWTPVGLLAAANALRFVLRTRSVDSEHIHAALSAYLLAGLSFGTLYWVLEQTLPGSLFYSGAAPQDFSHADGIYLSFVTLATLGYGDFVPKSDVARGMTILEAIAGQLYLGVMVARLVSLYVSGETTGKREEPKKGRGAGA